MKGVRILLADDHKIFLEGLQRLLESDFDVVGMAEDGRTLVSAAQELQPDVIIADISMPGLNGIEAAQQLRKASTRAKIIFLSMHADASFVREGFRAGASGYVVKRAASDELAKAIWTVLQGGIFLCPCIGEEAAGTPLESSEELEWHNGSLTPRQREVLQLVAEGRTIKEIARTLEVSPKTAEFHKYSLMQRLGVRTTADLTKYAVKHGFVEA
jgi:DNA-binding NarL/FixJ family response regulator